MKTLRILLIACLALCLCFALAACGAKTKTAEEGKLIMATNAQFPPYEYYEGDKIVGIDAEIAAAIADKAVIKEIVVPGKIVNIVIK